MQVCVDIVYSSTPFGSSQVDFVLNTDNGTAFCKFIHVNVSKNG